MGFAHHSFPSRKQQAELEAARLTQELLERARLAHRQRPEGPVRRPAPNRQFENHGLIFPMPRPIRMMREHPEAVIVMLCFILCSAGLLRHAML